MTESTSERSHSDCLTQQQDAPKKPWLAITIGGFFFCYVLIAIVFLRGFPNSGDEYAYLLQAKIFAEGRLSVPAAPEEIRAAFTLDHVVDTDGRVRSKYPPGWPLLLSVGESVGLSWAVNPALAALTLFLLFRLVSSLLGDKTAWLAILFLGASPFFVFNAASYMSHTSTLLLQTLTLYAFVYGLLNRSPGACILAGLAGGYVFLIRPLDGLLCASALLVLVRRAHWKLLLAALAGALPIGLFFLWYNYVQFGGPFTTGHSVYAPIFLKLYGWSQDPRQVPGLSLEHIIRFKSHLLWYEDLAAFILPASWLLVPLGVWHLKRRSTAPARSLLLYAVVLLAMYLLLLHLIVPVSGDTYGPRFIFCTLLPLALLIAAGARFILDSYGESHKIPLAITVLLVFLLALVATVLKGLTYQERVDKRRQVYQLATAAEPRRAVILLRHTDSYPPHWYTRNGTSYRGRRVYVIDRGRGNNRKLREHYPNYKFLQYRSVSDPQERRTRGRGRGKRTKKLVPYRF